MVLEVSILVMMVFLSIIISVLSRYQNSIQLEFVEMIGGKKHFLSSDAESSGNVYNGKWPL